MKSEKRYELWVVISMLVIIAVYTIALLLLPERVAKDSWYYEGSGIRYLFLVLKTGVSGVLLVAAFKKWTQEGNKKKSVMLLLAAILLFLFGIGGGLGNIKYAMQKILMIVWPMMMLALFSFIAKKSIRWSIGLFLYYFVVTVGIWFITDRLAYSAPFEREILGVLYLILSSAVAWNTVNKKCLVGGLLAAFVSLGALMVNHTRLLDITQSFSNPMSAVSGKQEEINWLGNRLAMMREAWFGDKVTYGGSLIMVHQVFGWIVTMGVIVAEIVLLYSLYKIYRENMRENACNSWMKMTFWAIALWSAIGVFAEAALISSSRMGLILLGNTEMIPLILFYLYMSKDFSNTASKDGDKHSKRLQA